MSFSVPAPLLILVGCMLLAECGRADAAPQFSISPDGTLKALECKTTRGTGICLHNRVDDLTRPLIQLPGHNRQPVFSPDGLFIAFIAEIGGRQIVTVTDLIGHSWPVADVTGIDGVAWSPDAVWLVFSPRRANGTTDIFRITAGGTHSQWLTHTPAISEQSPYFRGSEQICYRTSRADNAAASATACVTSAPQLADSSGTPGERNGQ